MTEDTDELQDVATGGDTTTVDLEDLVADLEAKRDELQAQKERHEAGDDVQWPPEGWTGLDFPIQQINHSIDLVRSDIDRFGGSEFVLKKARAGEAARATDLVAQDIQASDGEPGTQIASSEHRLVQVCVERAPPDAPTQADGTLSTPAFERQTFEWLLQRVKNFNQYGVTDIDHF